MLANNLFRVVLLTVLIECRDEAAAALSHSPSVTDEVLGLGSASERNRHGRGLVRLSGGTCDTLTSPSAYASLHFSLAEWLAFVYV